MLVGSTFAWFTDTASVNVNTIQAGTLDIVLEYWNGTEWKDAEGKVLNFVKASGHEGEAILWEPGCTYELPKIRVRNEGNLTATILIKLNGIIGDEKLLEAIELKTKVTNVPESLKNGSQATMYAPFEGNSYDPFYGTPDGTVIFDWTLAPKGVVTPNSGHTDTTAEFTISGHMDEEAGNEFQGLSMEGISITVLATQGVYEYDSYGREYDEDAEFDELVVVTNKTELNDAIADIPAGEPVTVSLHALPEGDAYTLPSMTGKDITFTGTKNTVVDLTNAVTASGSNVAFEGITVKVDGDGTYKGIQHAEKVSYNNCTLNGTQFLYSDADFTNCEFNVSGDKYNIWVYGNNATFTNCVFNCDGKAVLQYNEGAVTATVTFEKCTFNDNDNGAVSGKAAVEIGESAYGNNANYTVRMNGCTVNGFDVTTENASTFGGTNLGTIAWGNKNLMPAERLNVIIDGVEVY